MPPPRFVHPSPKWYGLQSYSPFQSNLHDTARFIILRENINSLLQILPIKNELKICPEVECQTLKDGIQGLCLCIPLLCEISFALAILSFVDNFYVLNSALCSVLIRAFISSHLSSTHSNLRTLFRASWALCTSTSPLLEFVCLLYQIMNLLTAACATFILVL